MIIYYDGSGRVLLIDLLLVMATAADEEYLLRR